MKRRLHHLIVLLLCGFFALNALEVSVGEYVNQFGDSYDTYVPATPEAASVAAPLSACPAPMPTWRNVFRAIVGQFVAPLPARSDFFNPPLSARIRLHLKHSVWLI